MSDQQERIAALNPAQSFIVQAPAGSGKTELLTQRFLKLLSTVKAPEQILAVTFTRKAAAQMRHRILKTLKAAYDHKVAQSDHERFTLDLAKAAILRDQKHHWNLLENPNRLHIVTIDSLCALLTSKLPVLSQMGVAPVISDFPRTLYLQAVQNLLMKTDKNDGWYVALSQLLLHQDNRVSIIMELLVNLLQKRDQWLHYVGEIRSRGVQVDEMLNDAIARTITTHLTQVQNAFASYDHQSLAFVARKAAQNIIISEKDSAIAHCADLQALPGNTLTDLSSWLGLSELLLTQKGEWRKIVNVNQGFPSHGETKDKEEKQNRKALKEAFQDMLLDFAQDENLLSVLAELPHLPPLQLPETQKQILTALFEVLPVLVAYLQLEFQEKGQIDFIELNMRAQEALSDEGPTDIQLALDYQLQHILIDEYQDTSYAQYRLFEKLICGWQPGDGRSLFMVGDPMQSIYRFRGAEVSLFLYTQRNGLGPIKLTPITLKNNFRSSYELITWFNQIGAKMFPPQDDISLGAVSYSAAIPVKPETKQPAVSFAKTTSGQLAVTLLSQLQTVIRTKPEDSVAILVRTRRHLETLIPLLKAQDINFVAYEVEQLMLRSHIQDLLSLLKATLNLTDIISWYAILRAPWLGLSLEDLLVLAKHHTGILWQAMENYADLALSTEAKQKLARFVPIMQHFMVNKGRSRVSEGLQALWIVLGGPSCYQQPHFLQDVDHFFELVRQQEQGGLIEDLDLLQQALNGLYTDVRPNTAQFTAKPVEIMTIHKSKGLEFDHVFIPHLETKPNNNQHEWFAWFERTEADQINLLLAAKGQRNESCDYYQYIQRQIAKKQEFELTRVLYVALTRAKQQLYLYCEVEEIEEEFKPRKGSFLSLLWEHVEKQSPVGSTTYVNPVSQPKNLTRLKSTWQLPDLIDIQFEQNKRELATLAQSVPEITDFEAKIRGTVFHRLLQWGQLEEQTLASRCRLALLRAGIHQGSLGEATALILKAIANMRACPNGQWILNPHHVEKHHEWSLTEKNAQGIAEHVVDYAFIDKDVRWIIDYKLSPITADNLKEHEVQMTQYKAQLSKYQRIIGKFESREVKCALYFPLTQYLWRLEHAEVDYSNLISSPV